MSNRFISEFLLQSFQLILFLLLVGFFGIYIFNREFLFFIANSAGLSLPIFLLFVIYLILTAGKFKDARKRKRKELEDVSGESQYPEYKEIYATNADEMKNDLLAFVSSIAIIFIAWLVNGAFDYSDVLQSIIVFLAIYMTKDIYFKKGIFGFGKRNYYE